MDTSTTNDIAAKFMQYDYKEVKELSIQFLTLITAVLVFSLAFSEKIIDFKKAKRIVKHLLLTSWSSFFVSIVGAGFSLVLNVYAASEMLYGPDPYDAFSASYFSAISLLIAGIVFVIGLAFLIIASFLAHRNSES